jgi:hypothetical protein
MDSCRTGLSSLLEEYRQRMGERINEYRPRTADRRPQMGTSCVLGYHLGMTFTEIFRDIESLPPYPYRG